jgi:hypothetical protein
VELLCTSCGRKLEYAGGEPPRFCARCGSPLASRTPEVVLPPVVAVPPVILPPVVTGNAAARSVAPPPLAPSIAPPIANESAPPAEKFPATAADADDVTLEATRCPNCGQMIEAGLEICVACGYSRRLGRTLTTRVGKPEIPRHKAPAAGPPPVAIAPEDEARRVDAQQRKPRHAPRGGADTMRLFIAIVPTLLLAGLLLATPFGVLKNTPLGLMPGRMTELAQDGQYPHAALLLALFLIVVVPITTAGVRIGALVFGIETLSHLAFLKVAGSLSAVLLSADVIYISDHFVFHLGAPWSYAAFGAEAGVALLLFTWYLHAVRFSEAIALCLFTVLSLAIAVFAAAVMYPFFARQLGIASPLIPGIAEWFKGSRPPG